MKIFMSIKQWMPALLLGCLGFTATAVADAGWHFAPASPENRRRDLPAPDLSQYDAGNLHAKMQAVDKKPGQAKLVRMFDVIALADFTAGERAAEWAKRQRHHPSAIVITDGAMSFGEIYEQLQSDDYLARISDKIYLLKVPLVIERNATLTITGREVGELRLSSDRGAFIANGGNLFAVDTHILGWRERANGPDSYRSHNRFRPFIVSWEGSHTYTLRTHFSHLGYNKSKSYGFTLSRFTESAAKLLKEHLPPPSGWLLESTFYDVYYGFYCYEAEDVVIYKNVYRDNIVYGIDPHDRSERLVIADNTVYGTRKKHGIIVSRSVNNSWIIRNRSFDNRLSGIVLDRASENNLVAENEVFQNGADGITLYESSHNLIVSNQIYGNAHHGIRMRNSVGVDIRNNRIIANGRIGILGVIDSLANTGRNLQLDPFESRIGLSVVGDLIAANGTGGIKLDRPEFVLLQDVKLRHPTHPHKNQLLGFLEPVALDLLKTFSSPGRAALYKSAGEASSDSLKQQ